MMEAREIEFKKPININDCLHHLVLLSGNLQDSIQNVWLCCVCVCENYFFCRVYAYLIKTDARNEGQEKRKRIQNYNK